MMGETLCKELEAVEEAFNRAMVSNNVAEISSCISEDWVLVTPEAGPVPRERFLQAVGQGILSHDRMTKDISRVRVYGNVRSRHRARPQHRHVQGSADQRR